MINVLTLGILRTHVTVEFSGVARPPTLGRDIDRCITTEKNHQYSCN